METELGVATKENRDRIIKEDKVENQNHEFSAESIILLSAISPSILITGFESLGSLLN